MAYGYSVHPDPATTAKASGRHVPVKPKHCREVCAAIRGMRLPQAVAFLEDVVVLKRAVPFRRFARNVAHRRGGMGPGQYPVRAASAILEVLQNAGNNAEYKGLEPEEMFVSHAATSHGRVLQGFTPRAQGRSTAWNKSTSHIEIVLSERKRAAGAPAPAPAPAAPAKGAAKPAAGKKAAPKKAPAEKAQEKRVRAAGAKHAKAATTKAAKKAKHAKAKKKGEA